MINACLVAAEINNMLPGLEIPRETEDYEGFYHLTGMSGDVAQAKLHYIVRDHDKNLFEARKETLRHIEKNLNEKWGEGTVKLTITDQYQNMAEIIAGLRMQRKPVKMRVLHRLCFRSVAAQTDASSALWDFLARTLEQGDMHSMDHMNTSRQKEWTRLWISQLSL